MSYSSLHAHTHYSNIRLLDSINKEDELIDNAFEKGLKAIAITDHDVLSGHVKAIQHYNKKKYAEKDFKLILGNEIYITREGMDKDNYEKGEKFYHFLLLARNLKGHEQLRKLSSIAWSRSWMKSVLRTPTFISDIKEVIAEEKGNIIATTACLAGIPATLYNVYGEDALGQITEQLKELEDLFGKGNFFIELQPINNNEQIPYNKFMIEHFWDEYPFVFTTDAHYLNKEDAIIHKQFLNSKNLSGDREVDKYYSSAYVMTYEEIKNKFYYIDAAKIEQMRLNTIAISDSVEIYDLAHDQIVPTVPVDYPIVPSDLNKKLLPIKEHIENYEYILKFFNSEIEYDIDLISKVFEGFFTHISYKNIEELNEYLERLNYELEQVWETSVRIEQPLSKYFTTMAKMIDIIWEKGDSIVGVSRGSAAGFLVNYLLGITQMDPLRQSLELPAWRFIHKDRPGLPDIDIDTEGSKRLKVFNMVNDYFKNIGGGLINVCTFGTEKSKSALRTAARGLEIDDDVVSFIVSLVPNERGLDWTLDQCMYGDEEHVAIKKFQEEVTRIPNLWKLARKIEGLITRLGVHASGVIAFNEDFTKHNSLMKTTKGVLVSAYNLDDTEYMGGLKYDFLTINALDKIRTTLNLLLEDGELDWEGNLRNTYNKYLLPKNLDYTNEEMWKMVHEGQIVDIFQFDTAVGSQAVKRIKPTNIAQLSVANSVMRLMSEGEGELPLDTYVRFKNDIKEWYREMQLHGLNDKEVKVLEKYLLPLSGVADSQESAMLLVMDPEISGFDVTEANSLRKAIAKKKADVMEETKQMFYEKGKALGASNNLLDYIWNVQIHRQAGYSFSVLHTMGYSTVALQEMNLAYRWPVIYWNTACLSVNAGAVNEEDYESLIDDGIIEIDEDDDNKRENNKIQYGKVAAAISKFREELNLDIRLPNINRAKFGFTPDADNNRVLYGLKGISRVGDNIIREIIANRPYTSLKDFLSKMNSGDRKLISKDKVVMLIKSGAFDEIEEGKTRTEILREYVLIEADQKKKLTLQNVNMLIEKELLPDSLDFYKRVFKFTKYIRRRGNKYKEKWFKVDDVSEAFLEENYQEIEIQEIDEIPVISVAEWESIYNREMIMIRLYISKNHDELLARLNNVLFEEEYQKYAKGNELSWELEAISLYHSGHELEGIADTLPISITKSNELVEDDIVGYFNIRRKKNNTFETIVIPRYNISHIIGTVLDKDKQKHTVILSTPEGVVSVKLFRNQFAKYDQTLVERNEEGEKVIIQDSFFKKGTFLIVTGIKRGDTFIPKVYKDIEIDPILMFEIEDGRFKKAYKKMEE